MLNKARVWWWLGKARSALGDIDDLNSRYCPATGHCCAWCAAGPQMAEARERMKIALEELAVIDPAKAEHFEEIHGL